MLFYKKKCINQFFTLRHNKDTNRNADHKDATANNFRKNKAKYDKIK